MKLTSIMRRNNAAHDFANGEECAMPAFATRTSIVCRAAESAGVASARMTTPKKPADGRFTYETAGGPAKMPLVFLHGIGGAARGWRGQLTAFGDRYRAVAWDMPGYGGSSPLPSVSIA